MPQICSKTTQGSKAYRLMLASTLCFIKLVGGEGVGERDESQSLRASSQNCVSFLTPVVNYNHFGSFWGWGGGGGWLYAYFFNVVSLKIHKRGQSNSQRHIMYSNTSQNISSSNNLYAISDLDWNLIIHDACSKCLLSGWIANHNYYVILYRRGG